MTNQSNSNFPRRRGTTVASLGGLALASVLLLCGAGNAPIENFTPQGAMQADLNAGGHSLTNVAGVTGPNGAALYAPSTGSANYDAAGAAAAARASSLQAANNLSDVASAASARANLGLGSSATNAASAYDAAGAAANGYSPAAASIPATVTINRLGLATAVQIALSTGSGPYTVSAILSDSGFRAGDTASVNVTWPTSTNPTLTFYDGSTSGTMLGTYPGTAMGGASTLEFKFTGTAWVHFSKGEVSSRSLAANVLSRMQNPLDAAGGLLDFASIGVNVQGYNPNTTALGNNLSVTGQLIPSSLALPAGSTIAIWGDSVEAGNVTGYYPAQELSAENPGVPVYDFAVGGTTAGPAGTANTGLTLLAAASPTYLEFLNGANMGTGTASAASLYAATAGTFVGVLDYGRNELQGVNSNTITTFEANMATLCTNVHALGSKAKVVDCTLAAIGNSSVYGYVPTVLRPWNNFLRSQALYHYMGSASTAYPDYIADVNAVLSDSSYSTDNNPFFFDGEHPSQIGTVLYGHVIAQAIQLRNPFPGNLGTSPGPAIYGTATANASGAVNGIINVGAGATATSNAGNIYTQGSPNGSGASRGLQFEGYGNVDGGGMYFYNGLNWMFTSSALVGIKQLDFPSTVSDGVVTQNDYGSLTANMLSTPTGLAVAVMGTAGTTTHSYQVTTGSADDYFNAGGDASLPTAAVTVTTSNATLSSTNYNKLTWTGVTGAYCYDVYKDGHFLNVVLAAQNATSSYSYSDTGVGQTGSAPPTVNTTGVVKAGNYLSAPGYRYGLTTLNAAGTLATNTSYLWSGGANATETLPAACAAGDRIVIIGQGSAAGLLTISKATGQTIYDGSGTAFSTMAEGAAADCVTLVCTAPNTSWSVETKSGSFTDAP